MGHQAHFFFNLWVAYLRIMLTASLRTVAPLQDSSSNGCVSDLSDVAAVCSRLKYVPMRSVACTNNSEARNLVWNAVKADKDWRIVFSSPIRSSEMENRTGEGYSAEYQYMHELMSWAREYQEFTVNYIPSNLLDQDLPLLTHRGAHAVTALVLVGRWQEFEKFRSIFEQLERDNVIVLWVHDSACLPNRRWIRHGCPSPQPKNKLFTPWGSSPDNLYADKTKTPSMVVDGTKPWGMDVPWRYSRGSTGVEQLLQSGRQRQVFPRGTSSEYSMGPSLEAFLRRVRAENMGINVTCLRGCERFPDLVDHCVSDKLPRRDFFSLLRGTWFFATGFLTGYELGKSDAQMAGAILVEASTGGVRDMSYWQRDDGHSLAETSLTGLVSGMRAHVEHQPAFARASQEVRQHAIDFHAPDYMWSNLLCSLHASAN
jgi:hypothetical protein